MKPLSEIIKMNDSSLSQQMISLKHKTINILRDNNINQDIIKDIIIDEIDGNRDYRILFKQQHIEFIHKLRKE